MNNPFKRKADPELKEIARDLIEGRIFSDRHCKSPEEVGRSFPVLMLMDSEQVDSLQEKIGKGDGPQGMVYEYVKNASPMGINGMPIFFSCKTLDPEQTKIIFDLAEKIEKKVGSV